MYDTSYICVFVVVSKNYLNFELERQTLQLQSD